MPTYTETHSQLTPDGGDDLSRGDDEIRSLKRAYDERLNEDHVKPADESGYTTVGYHRKSTLIALAANPTGVALTYIIFAKDVGAGQMELFGIDQAENVIQLTNAGKIKLSAGRLENAAWLTARNAAGAADLNLIRGSAGDVPEITAGAILSTSAAPTVDAGIANKKYVDDQIDAIPAQTGFGAWEAKSFDTIYQASLDGFLVGNFNIDNGDNLQMLTDSSTPPTTVRQIWATGSGTTAVSVGFCCPIKKNDYYKFSVASGAVGSYVGTNLYFIPLGV